MFRYLGEKILMSDTDTDVYRCEIWFIFCTLYSLPGCPYLWIPVTSYFQASSKDIVLSVSLPLPILPRISSSTRLDSSDTLALYNSRTYLQQLTNIFFTELFTSQVKEMYRSNWNQEDWQTQTNINAQMLSYQL